jgi:pyruvate,orthophosphate dikinase
MNDIPYEWGTAVNVQAMVFGNMGDTSGTGVVFTRNAATGENAVYGEYLINAQGEDVVAGTRTPKAFTELEKEFPDIFNEFMTIAKKLERHYKDIQDMEFTFENNKLYILQTRNDVRHMPRLK